MSVHIRSASKGLLVLFVLGFAALSQMVACAQDQAMPAQAAPAAASAAPADPGWPRTYEKAGNQVIVYQPQVDQWQDFAKIVFRAAVAVTPAGEKEPQYGVVTGKAITEVDHDTRTVLLQDLDTSIRFSDVPKEKAATLEGLVKEVVPQKQTMRISLDRVLAYMAKPDAHAKGVKQLGLGPPPIFRSEVPAILVVYVGQPQFKPIKDTQLMFAVNTNWDVLMDQDSKQYYLRDGNSWLTAADPVKGPWTEAPKLPDSFSKLPPDANWTDVRNHIPGEPFKVVPKVFASTTPAELILTDGAPAFMTITGTTLAYVNNPQQAVFTDTSDKTFYYLVAGRWFGAKSLDGPWTAASADLPADFGKIPNDCPVSYVLASVPRTAEADDAVLLASVPHKAQIDRATAKVDVTYEGPPQFTPIQGTTMQYATNSPQQVISVNGQYYCCYQGVWFMAQSPTGPWAVAPAVPQQIYTIPPTCPVYNTTYVQVYDSTPDYVTVGYTGGYYGEYVAPTGVLMFGAGMAVGAALADNSAWYACNPAFYSYGCGAYYHYGAGGFYGTAGAMYGPYGGVAHAAAYNPATGTYNRAAAAWGPAGAATAHAAYNPYTGNYAAHAGATNGYQSWGHSVAQVGNTEVQAAHRTGPEGSAGWAETSSGKNAEYAHAAGGGTAVKTANGDVYAGKDGNVYQKSPTGGWQQHTASGWQDYDHQAQNQQMQQEQQRANEEHQQQMNQEAAARNYGNERAAQTQQYHGGGYGGGDFHGGGGGGYRGGGGRR